MVTETYEIILNRMKQVILLHPAVWYVTCLEMEQLVY